MWGDRRDAPRITGAAIMSLTRRTGPLSFQLKEIDFMAENIPNTPAGAMPPKKETGKVQPKKETVRINLPPKPSAAPTIKLPTLPPGGPTGGGAPGATPAPSFGAPAAARRGPGGAAPATAARPAPVAAPRPVAAPVAVVAPVSNLDIGLGVAAGIVCVAALGSTIYLWQLLGW